jgi:hypothetical protein
VEGDNGSDRYRLKGGTKGGTFSHNDIALEFCTWLSPLFKLLILKEFQRLKESDDLQGRWDIRRYLSRVNHKIQTDAVARQKKYNVSCPLSSLNDSTTGNA